MAPSGAADPAIPGLCGGDEPPAVISLLAGRLDETGYPATLLDLAARGWFGLAEREPGRLMCVLPPSPPSAPLAPYEQRAALHLVRRAAGRGEVPAAALAEGFADGQAAFAKAFHQEVVADARQRGLIKPTLRGRTALLLCAAALIPAAALGAAVDVPAHHGRAFLPILCWLVLIWLVGAGLRGSERPTRAGRACLSGWRHRQAALTGQIQAAPPGPARTPGDDVVLARQAADGDRAVGYAAALGAAPAAAAVFTRNTSLIWSAYGGHWRQLTVGSPAERPWSGGGILALYGALGLPAFFLLVLLGTEAVRGFTGALMVLGALAIPVSGAAWFGRARRVDSQLPRSAEFDGVVLERWTWAEKGDEGADITCHAVAIDDGQQAQAWAFTVDRSQYAKLVPGTLVRATVNPRRNRLTAAEITGRPQLPPQAAAAEAARRPLRYRLIRADEAARVLGVPEQELQCYLLGVSCMWKWSRGRRSLMLTSGRRAMLARHAERSGRPLPGRDGVEIWLVGRRAVLLRRGTMVAKAVISGRPGPDPVQMLTWLAGRIAERLATEPAGWAMAEDEWAPLPGGS